MCVVLGRLGGGATSTGPKLHGCVWGWFSQTWARHAKTQVGCAGLVLRLSRFDLALMCLSFPMCTVELRMPASWVSGGRI